MYRVLDDSAGNVVGIKIEGKLTKEDYDVLVPYLENLIQEHGRVSLLCDMTDFAGMELEAFWEDFKFGLRHLRDFERLAVVGDQRWLEWCTKAFSPIMKTEVKYFRPDQLAEAWQWVRASSPNTAKA